VIIQDQDGKLDIGLVKNGKMKNLTVEQLIKSLKAKEYAVFEGDKKAYNLNIVGIREDNPTAGKFNDLICVFWKYEGRWNMIQMQCTTLAGIHWLKKPLNKKGCAILKPGQYRGVWKLDYHQGKYKALCQRGGEVKVYRDDDKDIEYDMIESSVQEGMFGINIHRAHSKYELEDVGKYSAGCQVIQDPDEWDVFMAICEKAAKVWGNSFSYTLLKEGELVD
jgi:hypothetical protein